MRKSTPSDAIYIKSVKHEKTDLHKIVIIRARNCGDVNRIGLAHDMVQWRATVNMVMILWITLKPDIR